MRPRTPCARNRARAWRAWPVARGAWRVARGVWRGAHVPGAWCTYVGSNTPVLHVAPHMPSIETHVEKGGITAAPGRPGLNPSTAHPMM